MFSVGHARPYLCCQVVLFLFSTVLVLDKITCMVDAKRFVQCG